MILLTDDWVQELKRSNKLEGELNGMGRPHLLRMGDWRRGLRYQEFPGGGWFSEEKGALGSNFGQCNLDILTRSWETSPRFKKTTWWEPNSFKEPQSHVTPVGVILPRLPERSFSTGEAVHYAAIMQLSGQLGILGTNGHQPIKPWGKRSYH